MVMRRDVRDFLDLARGIDVIDDIDHQLLYNVNRANRPNLDLIGLNLLFPIFSLPLRKQMRKSFSYSPWGNIEFGALNFQQSLCNTVPCIHLLDRPRFYAPNLRHHYFLQHHTVMLKGPSEKANNFS